MKLPCPFCENDGCCFCEHSGQVKIGEGEAFNTKGDFDKMVERVFRNRKSMMEAAVDSIKQMRGEKIDKNKTYDIDYRIEDW